VHDEERGERDAEQGVPSDLGGVTERHVNEA
jgi:hypothetical protein